MTGLAELTALALASFRATRIAIRDSVTQPLHTPFFHWHQRRTSRGSTFVVTLLTCAYCAGWWISGAVLVTYLLATGTWDEAPLLVHGLEWLAVAGGQALLNAHDDAQSGS